LAVLTLHIYLEVTWPSIHLAFCSTVFNCHWEICHIYIYIYIYKTPII
jgi:hypothetical protein